MEIYGSIKLQGSLADGSGDPLLTKDSTTNEVGTATNSLGTLTDSYIFVGDATNAPVGVAVSGDITLSNAGVVAIGTGVIVNADINASAAIAFSKMAALTASRALVSDGSGVVSVSDVTATEVSYLDGVTSAIQTQIDGKQATVDGAATTIVSDDLSTNLALISNGSGKVAVSAVTSTELGYLSGADSNIQDQLDTKFAATIASVAEGDILYYNGTNWVNLARGTNGQALYSTATTIQWDTPTINGIPVGGSDGQVLTKQSGTDFDADWETLTVASITDLTATAAELNVLDGITATVTELNYVDGVSSSIQTQLDGKLSTTLPQNAIFVGNSSNVATSLSGGTNGYVLTSVSGVPTWAAVSAGTPPGADTQMIFNDAGSFGTDTGFTYNKTTDTLTVVNLDTNTEIGGEYIYRAAGTDVALADGGTGASLADPGADRIMFWDDSAGAVTWLTIAGTAISDTTLTVVGGSTGATDNAILTADGTGGGTVQASTATVDDSGNIDTSGSIRSTGIFGIKAQGTSDSAHFSVNWLTSTIASSGSVSQGVDIFLSNAGVELEDKSAIVTYHIQLTKADGSDCVLKEYKVGYRKDGAADPVQVGTALLVFDVGNATPSVSFGIVSSRPSLTINDNASGGWKVKVWAQVSLSN